MTGAWQVSRSVVDRIYSMFEDGNSVEEASRLLARQPLIVSLDAPNRGRIGLADALDRIADDTQALEDEGEKDVLAQVLLKLERMEGLILSQREALRRERALTHKLMRQVGLLLGAVQAGQPVAVRQGGRVLHLKRPENGKPNLEVKPRTSAAPPPSKPQAPTRPAEPAPKPVVLKASVSVEPPTPAKPAAPPKVPPPETPTESKPAAKVRKKRILKPARPAGGEAFVPKKAVPDAPPPPQPAAAAPPAEAPASPAKTMGLKDRMAAFADTPSAVEDVPAMTARSNMKSMFGDGGPPLPAAATTAPTDKRKSMAAALYNAIARGGFEGLVITPEMEATIPSAAAVAALSSSIQLPSAAYTAPFGKPMGVLPSRTKIDDLPLAKAPAKTAPKDAVSKLQALAEQVAPPKRKLAPQPVAAAPAPEPAPQPEPEAKPEPVAAAPKAEEGDLDIPAQPVAAPVAAPADPRRGELSRALRQIAALVRKPVDDDGHHSDDIWSSGTR